MGRVEFKNKAVTLDGNPRFIFSGEISQFRLPADEWRDRLEKMAALGLNCIGVYAGWNFHSPEPGIYDFESPDRDFGKFLDEAQRAGLHVMARPGPYVCNEWDLGGFPGWLLRENPNDWRTAEKEHVKHCLEWYRKINEVVAPRQIDRGGPVVLYQVENEHFWGHRELFDALSQGARNDGITVPLMSNGGGSVNRCGSKSFVDGCDIYTNVYEHWRWRGWLELAARLAGAGDAPLMVVEYNASSFGMWGKSPSGEALLPSEWMLSLTRMFLGMGANLLNPFVVAGGITPVDFGSDHCCTAYLDDAAISHWGGLGRKFYLLRLLTEAVSSTNEALVRSVPAPAFWATDSGHVEGLLRDGEQGKFVVAVNSSTHREEFHLVLPDGRRFPESGTFSIPPRVSQFHLLDLDCEDGIRIEYSTAQVMKIWRNDGKLNIVVYGEKGSPGHAILFIEGKRVRADFVCRDEVDVVRLTPGKSPVDIFAVSNETAERTWFVKLSETRTIALFGNLDLVRVSDGGTRAEIGREKELRVFTDGTPLAIEGLKVTATKRSDGLIEHLGKTTELASPRVQIGAPSYRVEDYSWTASLPAEGGGWTKIEACRPGREVITRVGIYQYVTEFECGGELPEYLEFLGLSSAEVVVYLNGRRVSVFPEKRRDTYHSMDDYRLPVPVAGIVRPGKNILALTLTIIGRHNQGNALFAGVSHPVIFYRQRREVALPDWEFTDFVGRHHMAAELDRPSPEFREEIASRPWGKIDFTQLPTRWEDVRADWLDVRCVRRQVEIPAAWKGRPIFLECGQMDDAWCYVNGKPAGRTYHQMSATFDLSEFSHEKSVEVMLLGRYYWQAKCLPSIVPRLMTADAVLPATFLRREGADGERGRYFESDAPFKTQVHPANAQALWMRREVTVEIPNGLIAPMHLELDEKWTANAVLYWNGKAIGRYSVVGPDRQFYIPSGILKKKNNLTIYIDGFDSGAVAGGVKVAPHAEQVALSLKYL